MCGNGSSYLASQYGAMIMKKLNCFNTVKVFHGNEITKGDLERLKFGGYLTVSQSGSSQKLVNALKMAKDLDLTTFNVVNVVDSPIT